MALWKKNMLIVSDIFFMVLARMFRVLRITVLRRLDSEKESLGGVVLKVD